VGDGTLACDVLTFVLDVVQASALCCPRARGRQALPVVALVAARVPPAGPVLGRGRGRGLGVEVVRVPAAPRPMAPPGSLPRTILTSFCCLPTTRRWQLVAVPPPT
jgi:hypothetical protein